MILKRLIGLLKSRVNVVVDGTGVMQTTASYSYINRIGRTIRKRDYFKIIIVIDPDDGLILTNRGRMFIDMKVTFFNQLLEEIPAEHGEVCGGKLLTRREITDMSSNTAEHSRI